MNRELLAQLNQQLRPEAWLGLMVALVVFTALAMHLYVIKPALAEYGQLATAVSGSEIERAADRASDNAAMIAVLEREVAELQNRLYGGSSRLAPEKMESFVIDQLDRISVLHDIQLVSVTPGDVEQVLMFDELLYNVAVEGGFFELYDWLQEVEGALRPMAVKIFEMAGSNDSERVKLNLRLVSYRAQGGVS